MRYEVNSVIRERMRTNEICIWQIADFIGISENTLNRWFRHELNDEQCKKVQTAINAIIVNRSSHKEI